MALLLELVEVIDNLGTEECRAVLKCRLVDDDLRTLGLDALHHALDGTLAEVVGVGLHRQAIYSDHTCVFLGAVPLTVTAIVARLVKHRVGDVVLAGAVALDYRLDKVLWDVGVVGEQLLGVLRKAVAAVAEGRVVVVGADSRVEPHALDDGPRVKTLYLRVGVKLVEVADAQGEVGVGEELHRLRLLHAHEERVDVLLDRPLLKKGGERPGIFLGLRVAYGADGGVLLVPPLVLVGGEDLGIADYDPRRIEVVVERPALPEELRGEEQVELLVFKRRISEELQGILDVEAAGVAHRYCGLDDHHGVRVDAEDEVYHVLYAVGVEVVLLRVVVCRGRYHDKVGVPVGRHPVKSGGEVQPARDTRRFVVPELAPEVFLDVLVLDGTDTVVDFLDFLRDDVHGCHFVVLGEECRDAEAYVAGAGNGYLNVFEFTHIKLRFSKHYLMEMDKLVSD